MSPLGDLFEQLDTRTCAELSTTRRPATFAPGQDLVTMGETLGRLFCLLSGRAKVWRPSRAGHALTLYYAGAGAAVGLVTIARATPAMASVTAVTPTESWWWPIALVRRLLLEDARFAANGLRIVSGLMVRMTDRLTDVTGATAEQQIGRALLRLAGEHADWRDENTVAINVTRQDLADLTGTTLYTASRTISDWGRRGLVDSERGRVTIRDPHALAALAEVD